MTDVVTTRPTRNARPAAVGRRTKIVATLGPATADPATLLAMVEAGMDVARINLSHGDLDQHRAAIAAVRGAAARAGRPLGIMLDLPGPKLRLGDLARPVELAPGARVTLGGAGDLPVTFPGLVGHLAPGHRVLLDDGAVELRVVAVDRSRGPAAGARTGTGGGVTAGDGATVGSTAVACDDVGVPGGAVATLEVVVPGVVDSGKGVNLPDTSLPVSAPTTRDEELLRFGLDEGVDFVALSFVRAAADVLRLKELIAAAGGDQLVVAKIEKPEALAAIGDVVAASDAVMVARGDLGVEIPPAEVPLWQKRIVALARAAGRPVITATQMLQSMIEASRPTRAEASDVANAIIDSTDAVMLSGETAVGAHPVLAVRTMDEIARSVEADLLAGRAPDVATGPAPCGGVPSPAPSGGAPSARVADAISSGACDVARKVGAVAIVTATMSGAMARAVARYRPPQPVVAVTPRVRTQRQLTLSWGVAPLLGDHVRQFDGLVADAAARVLASGVAAAGDTVVLTSGTHVFESGGTNLIKVHVLG